MERRMKRVFLSMLLCGLAAGALADEPAVTVENAAVAPKVEYLSDLLSDRRFPSRRVGVNWAFDTMVVATASDSKPAPKLRIKDKEYARGLGHHANGEIVFDLSGQFKTFEAEVGLQWSDGKGPGSVVFQVLRRWQEGLRQRRDARERSAAAGNVSVAGADELRLVANDAGDGITSDCADWADARLTRDPAATKSRRADRRRRPFRPCALLGSESHGRNEGQPLGGNARRGCCSLQGSPSIRGRNIFGSNEGRDRQHRLAMGRDSVAAARRA